MSKDKADTEEVRSVGEAWDLALKSKGLVYWAIEKFVYSHPHSWYDKQAMAAEVESYAWEGMFRACRKWNEKKGALSTYALPAMNRAMLLAYKRLLRMGGTMRYNPMYDEGADVPYVDSSDRIEEEIVDQYMENEGFATASLVDKYGQPWDTGPEGFENELVAQMDAERSADRIWDILLNMPDDELHKTVFTYIHLLDPPKPISPKDNGKRRGCGWTLKETGDELGLSTVEVTQILNEAEEYIKRHLAGEW